MMRKIAVAVALATTALATPAFARDDSWYVGADGGVMLMEDIHYDIGVSKNAAVTDNKVGYDFDGNIGYDFGMFRVEAEVGYKRARLDAYRSTLTTPRYTAAGLLGTAPIGQYNNPGGLTSSLSFMGNAMLDFGDEKEDGITGFVGGGAGIARVKAAGYKLSSQGSFIRDSDTGFAYQALAGVRVPLTSHVDVGLKYRFFTVEDVTLVDVTGRVFNGRVRTHSLLGSLSYNFGEPAAPPPLPPPTPASPPLQPPPPPPPPAPVCTPGPFIVFFEFDKSDITPEAAGILDNAISAYSTCGNAQVMLAGHADRSGSASYNVGLSQRRADSVKGYLASHSIPDGVITTQAFGESRPRVETADGVRELQNRRVEIMYGPGSGQ